MKHVKKLKKSIIFILTALAALAVALLLAVPSLAQTVTQGYGSDVPIQQGMIVGLEKNDLSKVQPINSSQSDQVRGVVVSANDSAVLLGSDTAKVYVATGGRFSVLVSDQNGNINLGDYVTLSSVNGIGMKASSTDPIVIGKALNYFNSSASSQVVGSASVKDSSNKEKQIHLGQVMVDISISKNPMLKTDDTLPGFLRHASSLMVGKPVSPVRVYISLLLLIITTIISGSLIYSAVRSSLISIGRNPLSKKSITRGLFQVVIIALMVFFGGVFGVYLLLKL
jgi:hypothetical protein